MTTLITGASGTIGSAFREFLIRNRQTNSFISTDLVVSDNVEYLDIKDRDAVTLAISKVDTVVHLADVVGVELVNRQSISGFEELLNAHLHLIRRCSETGKKLVLASSSEVYGSTNGTVMSEDDDVILPTKMERRHLYARSKLLMESYANECFENRLADLLIVRFFNVVGRNQKAEHGFVLPRFVQSALKNEPLFVYGDGSSVRYFCHVDDAVSSLYKLIHKTDCRYSLYNIGADNGISIRDLADLVVSELGSSSQIRFVKGVRGEDILFRKPNLSRLVSELGNRSTKSLTEIIVDLASHYNTVEMKTKHY